MNWCCLDLPAVQASSMTFKGKTLTVKELKENDDFKDIDIALTSAGGGTSKKFASTITKHGAIMIDNSSAFRMDEDVPLVVPEVNPGDLHSSAQEHRGQSQLYHHPDGGLPEAHQRPFSHNRGYMQPPTRLPVVQEQLPWQNWRSRSRQIAAGEPVTVEKFQYQLALNLIPHVDVFTENGYTKEEMKMYNESRKIMHSDIEVSSTCVRVPVLRNHSEAIWVETEEDLDLEAGERSAVEAAEGVTCRMIPRTTFTPCPWDRPARMIFLWEDLRKDLTNPKGIAFWCVGDQIKKGAALNAVQIAEYLVEKGLV